MTGRTKDGTVFPLTMRFTGQSCEPIEVLSDKEVHQTEGGIVEEKEQQQDDSLENEKVYCDIEQKQIDDRISHDDHVTDPLLPELHTSHNTCISHDDHVTDSVLQESHVSSNTHISHDDHVYNPVLKESHVSNNTRMSHDDHVTNPALQECNNTRISHDDLHCKSVIILVYHMMIM